MASDAAFELRSPSSPTTNAPIACALCGTPAPDGVRPLTWSTSVEGSGSAAVTHLYCDRCSREHLRDIEGKLDAVWW